MRKGVFPLIGAVITALLSTLCCLPAFLFIFFGVSSGVLTYFTTLEYTRIPLAILAIIFFFFALRNYRKKISCKCTKKEIVLNSSILVIIFILFFCLLFYPEILPYFMD